MTVRDRCTDTNPHPAHRAQYGPFGVKDCPGVPITPQNAPEVPAGPAPASSTPLRKPAPVELAIRELERRVGQLEDRVDEHLTPSEYDPADDESEPRRMLDQAIDAALPLAGGRVRELIEALRHELAHVDVKRADQAEG